MTLVVTETFLRQLSKLLELHHHVWWHQQGLVPIGCINCCSTHDCSSKCVVVLLASPNAWSATLCCNDCNSNCAILQMALWIVRAPHTFTAVVRAAHGLCYMSYVAPGWEVNDVVQGVFGQSEQCHALHRLRDWVLTEAVQGTAISLDRVAVSHIACCMVNDCWLIPRRASQLRWTEWPVPNSRRQQLCMLMLRREESKLIRLRRLSRTVSTR